MYNPHTNYVILSSRTPDRLYRDERNFQKKLYFFEYSIDISIKMVHTITVFKINTEKTVYSMKKPRDQLMLGLKDRCQKLNAGEKFLSVRQIMEEFGVSQITVKQAIERLCESGVLEARDR